MTGPTHPLSQNPGKYPSLRSVTVAILIVFPKYLSNRFLSISTEQNLVLDSLIFLTWMIRSASSQMIFQSLVSPQAAEDASQPVNQTGSCSCLKLADDFFISSVLRKVPLKHCETRVLWPKCLGSAAHAVSLLESHLKSQKHNEMK